MRDNLALSCPTGRFEHGDLGPQQPRRQTLTTLAALMSGIVGSKRTQLPPIATQVHESRVKCFPRWCDHEATASALGSERSMIVGELPTDGEILCVRLWYVMDGTWQFSDCQYTAALAP